MLNIEKQIPLKNYSTFKIGGPAKYFCIAKTEQDFQEAFQWATLSNEAVHVVGKGSNSLFDDKGFDGLVIYNKIDHLSVNGNHLIVGAGYSFSLLGIKTAKLHLAGLEFASGIPGTVGGAIYMNAGANAQETSTHLISVKFIGLDGNISQFRKDELEFRYRFSSFHQMKGAILEASFELHPDTDSATRQRSFIDKRISSQPYTSPSCGCIFRNPQEISAGRLIDQCGLKNLSIGDAKISDLHANFIVNANSATAANVLELIAKVQCEVKKQTGIQLEHEIQMVPYKK